MSVTRTVVNVSTPNDIPLHTEKGGGGTAPTYEQPRRQKGVVVVKVLDTDYYV